MFGRDANMPFFMQNSTAKGVYYESYFEKRERLVWIFL